MKYGDFDYGKLQKVQSVAANFEYWQGFYVVFERATKSLTLSAYPMFEHNGPEEAPLFTARLAVTQPPQLHFDYGKLMLPHADGPRARRIMHRLRLLRVLRILLPLASHFFFLFDDHRE